MIRGLLLSLMMLPATAVTAQDAVVIYRCTDAAGAVSIQNDVPCPTGSQQQRRVMEAVPTAYVESPPAIAPLTPLPQAPVVETPDAVESRLDTAPTTAETADGAADSTPADPPPALFSCRTWDRKDYFSDDPVPTRRCAPLRVSGLDGSAGGGNASACEYVTDRCAPVPADTLCRQWQRHAQDTRAMLLFGRAEDPAATRAELERIDAILQASACKNEG